MLGIGFSVALKAIKIQTAVKTYGNLYQKSLCGAY